MKMILLRLPMVLLLACASLTGCISLQPPPLYRLDNGAPQVPEQTSGAAVLLGPVTLADYLQREVILQRQADGSLSEEAARARWAGSLKQDIDQLLLRQLASRLKTQRLALSPANEGFKPDVQLELSISRLDSGPEYPAVLEAQWRLLDETGKQQESRLIRLQEAHQGTTADQVRAQSVLLQRLSEQLATAIEPVLASRSAALKRQAAKKKAQRKAAAQPRLPAAESIRTDLEVFRF